MRRERERERERETARVYRDALISRCTALSHEISFIVPHRFGI